MAGISAIESKLKTLDKKTEEVANKNYTSVVWFDDEGNLYVQEGKIPWPSGYLCVPLPMSASEWERGYRDKRKTIEVISSRGLKKLDP